MRVRRSPFYLVIVLAIALLASKSWAHESLPIVLRLTESPTGSFTAALHVPASEGPPPTVSISLPQQCKDLTARHVRQLPGSWTARWLVDCGPRRLTEGTLAFVGLQEAALNALLQVEYTNGHRWTQIVSPSSPFVSFRDDAPDRGATDYLLLGVKHIFSGMDHLLFITCLTLIVVRFSCLLKTISAFTIAHSLTLGAATLGFVTIPSAPVEATIALSIIFLARELTLIRAKSESFTARYPWVVAFSFGLLHGFGFAGALSEVGLPPSDIPLALLFFNLGVEAGQLVFVASLIGIRSLTERLATGLSRFWTSPLPSYGIGAIATFWFLQRVASSL